MTPIITNINFQSTWPIRHKVMWPNKPLDYIKIEGDEGALHYGVVVGEELVSIVSLYIDGTEAQFIKLATLPKAQGKGYATLLINHLIQVAKEQGAIRLWCNARKGKTHFYRRFGMRCTDEEFSKGEQDYVVMELDFY